MGRGLTLNSSKFMGNSATSTDGAWGGAILTYNVIQNITGSLFKNNTAVTSGGAIYSDLSYYNNANNLDYESKIIKSNFENNSAAYGGAIYHKANAAGAKLSVSDTSLFKTNKVTAYGGAIAAYSTVIDIANTSFESNSATSGAGAILLSMTKYTGGNGLGHESKIQDTSFISNSSKNGGAIYLEAINEGHKLSITGKTGASAKFESNTASTSGGAIFAKQSIFNIDKVTFDSNIATTYGGAIYYQLSSKYTGTNLSENKTTISNSTFTGNNARYGGAIYAEAIQGHKLSITDSKFDNNKSTYKSTSNGGALYAKNTVLDIENTIFTNNAAETTATSSATLGGAIYLITTGLTAPYESTILDSSFTGNNAQQGGAIYARGSGANDILTITNTDFSGNIATKANAGGAIYSYYDNIEIVAENNGTSTFENNTANGVGNDIYMNGSKSTPNTLNLTANTGGIVSFQSGINGSYYNINIDGDGTGRVNLYTSITGSPNINVADTLGINEAFSQDGILTVTSTGKIDTSADGKAGVYNLGKVKSETGSKYLINLDLTGADKLIVAAESEGKIYLSGLNLQGEFDKIGENEVYKFQILDSSADGVELTYDNSKVVNSVAPEMSSDIIIAEGFGLTTTKTTNDSIQFSKASDVLAAWANLDTSEDKTFKLVDDYVSTNNNITLKGVNLTITSNDTIKRIFDVRQSSVFSNIASNQIVNINKVHLYSDINNQGQIKINSGSELTLDNGITGNGSIVFASDSKLNVITDKTQISNDVTTNGATLNLIFNAAFEGSYQLVTGNITDKEFTIAENPLYSISNKDADGNETLGTYYITKKEGGVENLNTDSNQIAAVEAIVGAGTSSSNEAFNDVTSDIVTLLQSSSTASEGLKAVSTMSPDVSPLISSSQIEHVNNVYSIILNRLMGQSIASNITGTATGDNPNNSNMWVQGMLDGSKLSGEFTTHSSGLAMGTEAYIMDDIKIGASYTYSQIDIDSNTRETSISSHTFSLYGEYSPSEWFVNGIGSYTYSTYDENKDVLGVFADASYNVNSFALQAITGYKYGDNGYTVTPSLGLRYIHINSKTYTDALGTEVNYKNSNILTAVITLKISKDFIIEEQYTFISPEFRVGLSYDLLHNTDDALVTLANGGFYEIKNLDLNRLAYEIGANITASDDVLEFSVGYEGKFRKDYQDHTGLINLKYNF